MTSLVMEKEEGGFEEHLLITGSVSSLIHSTVYRVLNVYQAL